MFLTTIFENIVSIVTLCSACNEEIRTRIAVNTQHQKILGK